MKEDVVLCRPSYPVPLRQQTSHVMLDHPYIGVLNSLVLPVHNGVSCSSFTESLLCWNVIKLPARFVTWAPASLTAPFGGRCLWGQRFWFLDPEAKAFGTTQPATAKGGAQRA